MSKKKLIILVSGLLIAAIVGSGGFFYLQGKGSDSERDAGTEESKDSAEKSEINKNKINFPLESFIVNLADPGGKRYFSTRIVLEFSDKDSLVSLEKSVPEIRDRILMILPTKTYKEIQSVEGKDALRSSLIVALNEILQEGKITNIFFQEFVVQ
jgi:flagellar protein FliL